MTTPEYTTLMDMLTRIEQRIIHLETGQQTDGAYLATLPISEVARIQKEKMKNEKQKASRA